MSLRAGKSAKEKKRKEKKMINIVKYHVQRHAIISKYFIFGKRNNLCFSDLEFK